jgi:hypothetical protein
MNFFRATEFLANYGQIFLAGVTKIMFSYAKKIVFQFLKCFLFNPILHTWVRESCFTCDGSQTIQVSLLIFTLI